MGEFDPTSVDWGRAFAEAVAIAATKRPRDAEDIAQQGLTQLLEGQAPFDPDAGATLAEHIVAAGLHDLKSRERTERKRRRPDRVAKLTHLMDVEPPTPEELNEEHEEQARAFEELKAECADDPEVHALVLLEHEGIDEASEQAERLKWDIEVVRNARKRMSRRVMALGERLRKEKEESIE